MRMRKKKHSAERIEACSELLVKEPINYFGDADGLFGRSTPKFLEIGCGKGDFASGLSARFRDYSIVALERVPDVAMFALEKAKKTASDRPDNLRFIIGKAEYLCDWFEDDTFDRIYVNFCDPWPKTGNHKRRLTAPSFLDMYAKLLVPGGELHFKTDNMDLFDWSMEQFKGWGLEVIFYTRDLHSSSKRFENIETEYERHFSSMGMPIYSAHVRFPSPKHERTEIIKEYKPESCISDNGASSLAAGSSVNTEENGTISVNTENPASSVNTEENPASSVNTEKR